MYDRKSIMHYVIQQTWTEGDFQIFPNLELSEHDKAFMAMAYPYPPQASE
jgi:leucyl-tRNA synthetase